jgi:hypothetical protein
LRRRAKIAIVARIEVQSNVKKKRPTSSGSSRLRKDGRRKHRHWQVTVYYHDGEKFARVYIDRDRAERFADRQKKSPVVKATRILEVD